MRFARLVLAAAFVLGLGGVVGVLVARDPGYVLVAYQDLAVETSLWLAVLALVLIFLLARLAWSMVLRAIRGGGSLRQWSRTRRERTGRDHTVRGVQLIAEGRWAEARKLLTAAAPRSPVPLVNYLNAARAAHELGDISGRDELLHAAQESAEDSRFAVGITRAELQQSDGQWEPCLATLLQLHRRSPRHPRVLRMLVRCYEHLEDWQAILELVPELQKNRVMSDEVLLALRLSAWKGRLRSGRETPQALWKDVPRDLRRDPSLVAAFALALADNDQGADAEAVLRETLEHTWNSELVRLYGMLTNGDPERQMVVAEGWLKERPNEPDLLLALGRISLMNRQWAKGREYLEASLRLRRSVEAQGELGRLCAALGETERARELLTQALDWLPVLPLPDRSEALRGDAAPSQVRGA